MSTVLRPATARPAAAPRAPRRRAARSAGPVVRYIVGALIVLAFILPLLWMISGSLKPGSEVFTSPPHLLPHHVDTQNYGDSIKYISFFTYLRNSAIVTVCTVAGTLFCCVPAAYALTVLKWRGKKVSFGIILFSIMLPFPAVMIPWYIVFRKLGMIGSILPLAVPPFVGQFVTPAFSSALAIFLALLPFP